MTLKIAVPNKGRLSEDAVEVLRGVGLRVSRGTDRALVAAADGGRCQVLFTRAQDIPEFVETGAVDTGITGLDLVEETGVKVEKLLDLGFGLCKLVVAAPENSEITSVEDIPAGARVATSFPNLAGRYFEKKKKRVYIIPVSGATEITPAIGVADLIVDLTQTGTTLKQHHLSLLDVILNSGAVLITGSAALRRKKQEIGNLVHALESVRAASGRRYLMVNVDRKRLKDVVKLIPGLKSPTIVGLAAKGVVAVHAVVDEAAINDLVPRLKKAGGSGILVLPIERMVP